jgi:hypothetical protein
MTNVITAALVAYLSVGGPAMADQTQSSQGATTPPAAAATQPAPAPDPSDPDARVQDAPQVRAVSPVELQPDFNLAALPTTLSLPLHKWSFRVTHRFSRPLGAGDFGDLVSDMFGLDSGAHIGLELRYGILPGTQIGIHRTNDRTIQFFAQHQVIRQDRSPVGIDAIAIAEGTNNFQDTYSPALGAVISRTLGRHGVLYLHPIWVNNTNGYPKELVDHNDTVMLGVGGRLRIRPKVYLVAEAAPRFGFEPNVMHASFAIERRAGGHTFQLNVSNGSATTIAQIARGGFSDDDWYLGFNISRKFF